MDNSIYWKAIVWAVLIFLSIGIGFYYGYWKGEGFKVGSEEYCNNYCSSLHSRLYGFYGGSCICLNDTSCIVGYDFINRFKILDSKQTSLNEKEEK